MEFKVELVNAELDIQNGSLNLLADTHHGNQTSSEILLEKEAVFNKIKRTKKKNTTT